MPHFSWWMWLVLAVGIALGILFDSIAEKQRRKSTWKPAKKPPKPPLQTTQKVRKSVHERPVIRRTQFRGKSRRKF